MLHPCVRVLQCLYVILGCLLATSVFLLCKVVALLLFSQVMMEVGLLFSSTCFHLLHLTFLDCSFLLLFRFQMHLESVFVYSVKNGAHFFFPCGCKIVPTLLNTWLEYGAVSSRPSVSTPLPPQGHAGCSWCLAQQLFIPFRMDQ